MGQMAFIRSHQSLICKRLARAMLKGRARLKDKEDG
jgi:hypothetical protein